MAKSCRKRRLRGALAVVNMFRRLKEANSALKHGGLWCDDSRLAFHKVESQQRRQGESDRRFCPFSGL